MVLISSSFVPFHQYWQVIKTDCKRAVNSAIRLGCYHCLKHVRVVRAKHVCEVQMPIFAVAGRQGRLLLQLLGYGPNTNWTFFTVFQQQLWLIRPLLNGNIMMIANKTCCGHQYEEIYNSPEYNTHTLIPQRQVNHGTVPLFVPHSYHFVPFRLH